ncbi:hypothetical protein AB0953_28315 [Streptomyces sp. NPDC046866]|uniref:hypothetical protein n=1 Tax=Streptomyces sp. NPDC046866 TaxID=3154921 RepID=UPI003454C30F
MRRGIIAAVVAGVAGATLGLMPVSSAFAAGPTQVPQNNRWCDDWRGDWRDCCDWNYRGDRYDRCWDVDAWYGYRNYDRYDHGNRHYNHDHGRGYVIVYGNWYDPWYDGR